MKDPLIVTGSTARAQDSPPMCNGCGDMLEMLSGPSVSPTHRRVECACGRVWHVLMDSSSPGSEIFYTRSKWK